MSDTTPPPRTSSRIWRPETTRGAQLGRGPRAPVGDVLIEQFDKGVALLGYGLLAFSVFTAGVPAVGALALASAHGRDSHLVIRTHYRYQVRIFWSGVMSFVLGIVCAIAAAAFALSRFWDWLALQFPWLTENVGRLVLPGDRMQWAGWLAVGAVVLIVYGAAHTLITSAWGAMKLVRGLPIGHIDRD